METSRSEQQSEEPPPERREAGQQAHRQDDRLPAHPVDAFAPWHADRRALRARLLAQREMFVTDPALAEASSQLSRHLANVLEDLAPRCLGAYWAIRSEFNPWPTVQGLQRRRPLELALPWSSRVPKGMVYRRWDGAPPRACDEMGVPSADGPELEPDVVLVPCVGFTRNGWRIGYGAGYFDRFLAGRPGVISVGVAWACAEVAVTEFQPGDHDRALSALVTEREAVFL